MGFTEFEDKKKKSIADILLGTSKHGAGSNGNTPRIISVYYPTQDQLRSQSQIITNRSSVLGVGSAVNNDGGGIIKKSLTKLGKGVVANRKKKVRFTDEIKGNNLTTVYEVESFKNPGSKNKSGEKEKENENCSCKCFIF